MARHYRQRLLLCVLVVAFFLGPILLGSPTTLSRYANGSFYAINAPQTNNTITSSVESLSARLLRDLLRLATQAQATYQASTSVMEQEASAQ